MNDGHAIERLQDLHERMLESIRPWNEADAREQQHPDLSPALWHVGHVAVIEAFWLNEVVLGEPLPAAWKALYFPERIAKDRRAAALPHKTSALDFAAGLFRASCATLAGLLAEPPRHALLKEAYLAYFLLQHCAQHRETLAQIEQLRRLRTDPVHAVRIPLVPADPKHPAAVCGGTARIGSTDSGAYDNERPRHDVSLASFSIAAAAVSNAEYLGFMAAGGYSQQRWWSEAGWHWRTSTGIGAPLSWRRDAAGHWYQVTPDGPEDLEAQAPVTGVSRHEAEAFARHCGCRLPTEVEWEHAVARGAIAQDTIGAWEWCENTFYPYPGFEPFPYDRYSLPWFDGAHFSLRGGSRHTHESVRRPTFRNFYTADKRHIFSGLRLARGNLNA